MPGKGIEKSMTIEIEGKFFLNPFYLIQLHQSSFGL